MLDIAWWQLAICLAVVFTGAALQATIGIGLGLLAAPILGLIDPGFVPAALVLAVFPLSAGMAVREHSSIDRRGIGWALVGRLPGVFFGAWLVARAGHSAVAVVVGLSVLTAVLASVTGLRFAPSNRNLFVAGATSGFAATASGIGGPPMAITYQHADPATMRATLAAFFTVGTLLSVAGLAAAGLVGRRQIELALVLVPAVLAGLSTARYTTARLRADVLRPIVLTVCAASAVVLVAEELL